MAIFKRFYIFLILLSTHAFAGINTSETIVSYPIYGNSGRELQAQMNQQGLSAYGHPFNASTQWFVAWKYRYKSTKNACYLTKVDLDVNIIYRLPKWMNTDNSNYSLRHLWSMSFNDLYAHEKGHAQNGIDAALVIEKALSEIPRQANCNNLHAIIDKTANRVIEFYQNKDQRYDHITQHGRKKGLYLRT